MSKLYELDKGRTSIVAFSDNVPVARMEWEVINDELCVYINKVVYEKGEYVVVKPLGYMLGDNALIFPLKKRGK